MLDCIVENVNGYKLFFPQSVLFWMIVIRSEKEVEEFAYSTPIRIQDFSKRLALNFLAMPLHALGA